MSGRTQSGTRMVEARSTRSRARTWTFRSSRVGAVAIAGDELVDAGAGDAGDVERAADRRVLAAEGVGELLAGGVAHRHVDEDGVEVEGLGPLAPLGAVDEADRRVDADAAQLLHEGREVLLGVGARVHDLEAELAVRADEAAALLAVAGVGEELQRLALAGAVALAALALVGERGRVVQDVADVVGRSARRGSRTACSSGGVGPVATMSLRSQ